MVKIRHQGLSQHRFADTPLERLFAREWEAKNATEPGETGTLDYLLTKTVNEPRGEATDRDRTVAATVIQWLGSNCGQWFIRDVMAESEKA